MDALGGPRLATSIPPGPCLDEADHQPLSSSHKPRCFHQLQPVVRTISNMTHGWPVTDAVEQPPFRLSRPSWSRKVETLLRLNLEHKQGAAEQPSHFPNHDGSPSPAAHASVRRWRLRPITVGGSILTNQTTSSEICYTTSIAKYFCLDVSRSYVPAGPVL